MSMNIQGVSMSKKLILNYLKQNINEKTFSNRGSWFGRIVL